jgi:hypothetical protein
VYKCPTRWEDLTVQQYDKIQAILKEKEEDETSIATLAEIVCAVLSMQKEVLYDAPRQLYNQLLHDMQFLFVKYEPANPKHEVIIDGVLHRFPTDENDISFGQFIDVDEVVKGSEVLSSCLAILLLPVGEKHNNRDFNRRKNRMKELKCSEVLPLVNFFFQLEQKYKDSLQMFFLGKEQTLHHLNTLQKLVTSGVGTQQLPKLQTMILLKWMKLLKSHVLKC